MLNRFFHACLTHSSDYTLLQRENDKQDAYQNKYPVRLRRKHKAAISGYEASRKKFTGPKKGRFPEIDDAVFKFFRERRKTGLFVSYILLRKETIKKARSLKSPRSRFKANK